MSTIPGVTVSVGEDADVLPPLAAQVECKVGTCSSGTANSVQAFTDSGALFAALGFGPLVDAASLGIASRVDGQPAPGPKVLVKALATVGTVGAVDATGATVGNATLAVTGAPNDAYDVRVLIGRSVIGLPASKLGAAMASVSVDGGATFGAETLVSAAGDLPAPGTGLTLTFTAGMPVTSALGTGDVYRFSTTAPQMSLSQAVAATQAFLDSPQDAEWVHVVGSPPPQLPVGGATVQSGTGPAITVTGTPTRHFLLVVKIDLAGARATATFTYSLDGGTTWLGAGTLTAATVALTGTGLTLNFATGNYVLAETYSAHSAWALPAWAAAFDSLFADAEAAGRYLFAVLEAPPFPAMVNSTTRGVADAALADAMSATSTRRVLVCAGEALLVFPNVLRQDVRSIGRGFTARLAAIRPSVHPGQFDQGPLQGVLGIDRDESKTPGLDAARFTTLRTFRGKTGVYVTRGRTTIAAPSQYEGVQVLRVVNLAARVAWFEGFQFLNRAWRTNPDATLDELAAQAIESRIRTAMLATLPSGGENPALSDALFTIDRTEPIGTSHTLKGKGKVRPLGYSEFIEFDISATANTATA